MTGSLRVRAAGQTAKGRSRRDNEDCYAVLCGGRLVVLADGTAGRPLGGIASWTAVEEVRRYAREQRWDATALASLDPDEAAHHIRHAFVDAHCAVFGQSCDRSLRVPMATSLTAALVLGHDVLVAHLGASTCCRVRPSGDGGAVRMLTREHRREPKGLASLDAKEARSVRPLVRVLERAIGYPEPPRPDLWLEPVEPGESIVVGSGGLFDAASCDAIADLVPAAASPEAACALLLQVACDAEDDCTTVVVQLGEIAHGVPSNGAHA